jgi:AraC-like DNA-binding protein
VHAVALDLGYESASGFVTMFRKAVGKPPARYMSDRKGVQRLVDEHAPELHAAICTALTPHPGNGR